MKSPFFCLLLLLSGCAAIRAAESDAKAEVLKAEAAFDQAKVHNDVAALDRILADECFEINQWGARRNKSDLIELFRSFATTSLVPSSLNVQVSGDVGIIDGIMGESNHPWKFLFVRTYVKRQDRWQLRSSIQSFAVDPETMRVTDPDSPSSQPAKQRRDMAWNQGLAR